MQWLVQPHPSFAAPPSPLLPVLPLGSAAEWCRQCLHLWYLCLFPTAGTSRWRATKPPRRCCLCGASRRGSLQPPCHDTRRDRADPTTNEHSACLGCAPPPRQNSARFSHEADSPTGIDQTPLGSDASIGAPSFDALRRDEPTWRVINLAMSGAKIADSLEHHLPVVDALCDAGHRPALTTTCVGTNDVFWGRTSVVDLRHQVERLADRLPKPSVMATIAGGSTRVALTNRALKQAALDRRITLVDPWREPGPGSVFDRVADDRFHPNDHGHQLMSDAFLRAIGSALSNE